MRQQIVFFLMLLGIALQAQKTTVQGDILKAKQEFWIQAKKITEISEDSSFTAASALRLVTQRAIKVYTDNRIGGRAYNAATTPTTGQVIKWNGTTWVPANDDGTSYTGGTGINVTGTVITNTGLLPGSAFGGDVTGTYDNLQIAANAIGTTELADNSVSVNKIGTAQVTMAKINQSGATTGQAIAWNGTAWAPATISGGGGTITGSGAANRLAYWSGTSALTSSANVTTDGTEIKAPIMAIGDVYNFRKILISGGSTAYSANAIRINTNIVWNTSTGAAGTYLINLEYSLSSAGNLVPIVGTIQLHIQTYSGTGAYFHAAIFGEWERSTTATLYKDASDQLVVYIGEITDNGPMILYLKDVRASNSPATGNIVTSIAGAANTTGLTSVATCSNIIQTRAVPFILQKSAGNNIVNNVLKLSNSSGNGSAEVGMAFYPAAGATADPTNVNSNSWSITASRVESSLLFRYGSSQRIKFNGSGDVLIGAGSPSAKIHVIGNGQTSATNSFLFANNANNGVLSGRDDGYLTASFYPNTRNDAGLPVNVFSSTNTGGIESHTAAELVAAGGGVTANIATGNLTSTGSYALTLVNNSLTFDASTSTNTISQPIIIKAKADGVNSSQPITFQDASSATLGYLYQNNLGVTLGGTTGKNITIASGTFGWTFHPNGVFLNTLHTSDPTTTGLSGGQWVNSTTNRLKFRTSAGVKTVATLEDDLAGTLTTYATDATPGGASYGTRVDAFSAPRTVTLGASLTEGRVYVIKGVRNNTNTITVNADSGYTLEIDGDASIGPTTFNMNAGEVFTAQRFGTQIIVNR